MKILKKYKYQLQACISIYIPATDFLTELHDNAAHFFSIVNVRSSIYFLSKAEYFAVP